jgi:hypothetical protein
MMGRRAFVLVTLVALVCLASPAGAAEPAGGSSASPEAVTVAELLAHPEKHAVGPVVVRGELVGDFGRRSDGTVWAQLNGDPYVESPRLEGGSLAGMNLGIGVRFSPGVWPGYEQPGGYGVRGPVVELTGMWRYHDPERSGESYLEVTAVHEVSPVRVLEKEGVSWLPLGLGLGFVAVAGAFGFALRRRRGQ